LVLNNIPRIGPAVILDAITEGKIEISSEGIGGKYKDLKLFTKNLTFTYIGKEY